MGLGSNPLRRIGAAILIVAVASAIVVPVVLTIQEAWKEGRRNLCKENLERIGKALHSYHDDFKCFPPAYVAHADGNLLHSWRVLILPQLGHKDLFAQYKLDEPWDGPNNSKLLGSMPEVYRCPSSFAAGGSKTSYVGVVSRFTAWPGPLCAKKSDITDGHMNTILVIECPEHAVPWMEPRDPTFDDALGRTGGRPFATMSTQHDKNNALFADGHVSGLTSTIDEFLYAALLTAGTNFPQFDVPWLPKQDLTNSFEAIKPVAQYPGTDLKPHRSAAIAPERTVVWCGSFQLSWNELKRVLAGPVRPKEPDTLVDLLNADTFSKEHLSSDSYYVAAGPHDEVMEGLNARFQNHSLDPFAKPREFVCLAYLRKSLPFEFEFDDMPKPLDFRSGAATRPVRAFGIDPAKIKNASPQVDGQFEQVAIRDYKSKDEFVVQVISSASGEIILAKVPPAETIAKTWSEVRRRLDEQKPPIRRPILEHGEPFVVPVMSFSALARFGDLSNRQLMNPTPPGVGPDPHPTLVACAQAILFKMDRRGVELESWGNEIMEAPNGHEQHEPRSFVFDKPFLVALSEPKASEPYFLAWIGNDDWMTAFEQKE